MESLLDKMRDVAIKSCAINDRTIKCPAQKSGLCKISKKFELGSYSEVTKKKREYSVFAECDE